MTGKLVIGFDGTDSGEDALVLGMRLSRATGDVPVVTAVYPEEYEAGMGRVDAEYVAYMREQAEDMIASARRILGDGVRAEYRVVGSSSAAHGLDDVADQEGAHAIVLGSNRRGALRRLSPGNTGERLLHGAACPVAIAPRGFRERSWGEVRSVGVAFLDTPDGREALDAAAALAGRIRAPLKLYCVVPRAAEFSKFAGRDSEEAFANRARRGFQSSLDAAVAALPDALEVTGEVLEGDVVDALASLDDRDVDLLVCGSRGYGPVRRVLLGGVSAQLMRRAAAPVMVVPRSATEARSERKAAAATA